MIWLCVRHVIPIRLLHGGTTYRTLYQATSRLTTARPCCSVRLWRRIVWIVMPVKTVSMRCVPRPIRVPQFIRTTAPPPAVHKTVTVPLRRPPHVSEACGTPGTLRRLPRNGDFVAIPLLPQRASQSLPRAQCESAVSSKRVADDCPTESEGFRG